MTQIKSDALIIGSGVAGLTLAIKLAEANASKKIIIATKAHKSESNTKYAQGGVAVVIDEEDSFESHIKDTLVAGDFLNDEEVVKMVIETAPDRFEDILKWGAEFDTDNTGDFNLGKEGGHSANRIVHHKDITGYEIERALLGKVSQLSNIEIRQHHFAIDLITDHHVDGRKVKLGDKIPCYGAYILNTETSKIETYISDFTILASGGAGQVYKHTTNPLIATGDGIAMAYRAKAKLSHLEFFQFHPTAFYDPGTSPSFLISEAVRGAGAYIRNSKGERFVLDIDSRGELASRDIVARAIDDELNITGENCVYLDCTHLDMTEFKDHFPNITEKCKSKGIDVSKDWIPVVPAAHYMCGGIDVDLQGSTSLSNVYAIGECAHTGLHGANRLASNSLLEALVYADQVANDIFKNDPIKTNAPVPNWIIKGTTPPKELRIISHLRQEVQSLMSDLVAIVRSEWRLKFALKKLDIIYQETKDLYSTSKVSIEVCELRNLTTVAYMIISLSMKRDENKGAFYKKMD